MNRTDSSTKRAVSEAWSGWASSTSSSRRRGSGGISATGSGRPHVGHHLGQRRQVLVPTLPPHVVAVGDPEPAVEAVAGGQEGRLVAAVPLADVAGGVPGRREHPGDGDLVRAETQAGPGEEDREAVELAAPDAGG